MAEPKKEPKPGFTIGFDRVQDAPTYAVGGAWGGPSPDGNNVVVHLYVEHFAVPIYLEYPKEEVEPGVVKIDQTDEKRLTRADVVRQVQASLVMTPKVALALAQFLQEKAHLAIQAQGRSGQGDPNA